MTSTSFQYKFLMASMALAYLTGSTLAGTWFSFTRDGSDGNNRLVPLSGFQSMEEGGGGGFGGAGQDTTDLLSDCRKLARKRSVGMKKRSATDVEDLCQELVQLIRDRR